MKIDDINGIHSVSPNPFLEWNSIRKNLESNILVLNDSQNGMKFSLYIWSD